MYRYPRLAPLQRYFAIHSEDADTLRIGRLLQVFLAIVLLGLTVRVGLRLVEGWGTAGIVPRMVGTWLTVVLAVGVSYWAIQHGRIRGVAHYLFLSLFISEMVTLWPTAATAQQYAPFLLFYLVGVTGILPVPQSAPYLLFCLVAAVRLDALGLDASRYIIVSLSIALVVWVIARAHKNALRQAQQATAELATLNATLQEKVAAQTTYLSRSNVQLQKALYIGRVTSISLNLDEQIHNTARLIRDEFRLAHVAILLLDEGNRFLMLREATGDMGRQQKQAGLRFPLGDASTLVGWVAQHREARQTAVANRQFSSPLHIPSAQAELALPLLTRNFLVGVLSVQRDTADHFADEEQTILQLVADQLANNIENSLLFTDLEQRTNNLTKLQAVIPLMSEQVNTQNALHVLAQQALELTSAEGAGIMLWQTAENCLEGVIHVGEIQTALVGYRIAPSQGVAGRCFAENRTIAVDDYSQWEGRIQRLDRDLVRGIMAVPVRERGTPLGVLLLVRQTNPEPFTPDDIQLVELLASQAGTIITNQQLLEETQQLANRERTLNQIAADIRRHLDAEMVLESAVSNLGRLLGDQRVTVRLFPPSESPASASPSATPAQPPTAVP